MRNKIRISNFQVFMCIFAVTIAYGHFVYTGLVFQAAGRDAWICLLVGFFFGSGILYLHAKLATIFPQHSVVQYSRSVFGRFFGSFVASLYILFYLLVASLTVAELSLFMGLIYPRTPFPLFLVFEFVLVAWGVRAGGEVVTRVIQLLLPLLVLFGVFASIFSLKDKDPSKLVPFFDHSLMQLTHGTLIYVVMICDLVVFCVFYPDVDHVGKLPKQGFLAMGILLLMFLGPATGPIMVFGQSLVRLMPYPTYSEIQYIEITGVLERLDIVGVLLWTFGAYMRASVFVLAATRGVAHLFDTQRETIYVFPIVVLVFGISLSILPMSREEVHQFLYTNYPLIALFVGLLLPLLTLVVHYGKGIMKGQTLVSK